MLTCVVFVSAVLGALHPPSAGTTSPTTSRRAVLFATAPLVALNPGAAQASNPLFGWIPEVGCSSGEKNCNAETAAKASSAPPEELSMAEKIRRRRKELEQQEEEKLRLEYQANRGNSAASKAMDAKGQRGM